MVIDSMRVILVFAALWATPFARLASQADSSITRFAWEWAELLTFADTTNGVELWLSPRPHVPHPDDVRPVDLSDEFLPDSVNAWVASTRASRAVGSAPAQRIAGTTLRSGALRGHDGTQIVAELALSADSDHDASDVLIVPKRGARLRFDLESDQMDGFLHALTKAASTARVVPAPPGIESDHVTPAELDSHATKARLRYPDALRDERIEGEVWVQFDIDASGIADMSTYRVLFTNHSEFEVAVRQYIGDAHFTPELRNGVPTRTRVLQAFRFQFGD